jgi:hypothetical protein
MLSDFDGGGRRDTCSGPDKKYVFPAAPAEGEGEVEAYSRTPRRRGALCRIMSFDGEYDKHAGGDLD